MLQVLILLLMMIAGAAQAQVTPTPLGEIKREPYVAKNEPVEPPKPKPAPAAPKEIDVPQSTGYPNGWRWVDLPSGFRACSTNPRTGQYQCGLYGYWVAR